MALFDSGVTSVHPLELSLSINRMSLCVHTFRWIAGYLRSAAPRYSYALLRIRRPTTTIFGEIMQLMRTSSMAATSEALLLSPPILQTLNSIISARDVVGI